jgi:hypothetical protein
MTRVKKIVSVVEALMCKIPLLISIWDGEKDDDLQKTPDVDSEQQWGVWYSPYSQIVRFKG